jgi:hypothetical protein
MYKQSKARQEEEPDGEMLKVPVLQLCGYNQSHGHIILYTIIPMYVLWFPSIGIRSLVTRLC